MLTIKKLKSFSRTAHCGESSSGLLEGKMRRMCHSLLAASTKRLTALAVSLVTLTAVIAPAQAGGQFVIQARLPLNAKHTCSANIGQWFQDDRIQPNGAVKPANSLDPFFADGDNNTSCTFFTWGSQMFLWLTSPESNSGFVFNESSSFFEVSVESEGKRDFLKNDGVLNVGVRRAKVDNKIDGNIDVKIELGQAGGGDVLISQNNSLVYYSIHANNVFALFATGKAKGKLHANDFPTTIVDLAKIQAFSDKYGYGKLQDSEALTMELKVSWVDAATVDASRYVTTLAEVPTFSCAAGGAGMSLASLRQQCPKGPWIVVGSENTRLAMVGMHVVGSVNGHPEMVWATFEHYNNVPNNQYTFHNQQGKPQNVAFNSYGDWNFLPNNAEQPLGMLSNAVVVSPDKSTLVSCISNVEDMSCNTATHSVQIEPVDVIRENPFGNNALNPAWIDKNTDLVSLNSSVLSQLQAGDVRGNYLQTGSIWTANGEIPPAQPYVFPPAEIPPPPASIPSSATLTSQMTNTYLRGSLLAANSTMETFHQFSESSPNAAKELQSGNCFACHGGTVDEDNPGYATDSINTSHIFNSMLPLAKP